MPQGVEGVAHMLEVIDKGSATESHPVPLLFVHGAVHAAWCWDDHFLGFFADNGYRVIALSLRGHGGSPASKPLNRCTIADYVDDVRSVAETLPAAVLVSSAPPRSWFLTSLRLSREHPWLAVKVNMTRKSLTMYPTPAVASESWCKSTGRFVASPSAYGLRNSAAGPTPTVAPDGCRG